MHKTLRAFTAALLGLASPTLAKDPKPLKIVRHHTRVKILDSNNVSIRTGSIYDNITYFESLPKLPKPEFNYEFIDTGLGAAEPLYPMYQKGYQGSWFQLIRAFFGETQRHIDHFTSLPTPEGCFQDSIYLLRHIDEFGKKYAEQKKEGYDLVVIRLEYYTRLRPDAQCGRHRANDPDPSFDPIKWVKRHLKAKSLADFPQETLKRFEAKVSVLRHMSQEFSRSKWPRFDLGNLEANSLWYYPKGHDEDYGINTPHPQQLAPELATPAQLLHPVVQLDGVRSRFGLEELLSNQDWAQASRFLQGQPMPAYDAKSEPGKDVLNLSDVTPNFYYTSGLDMEPITDPRGDVLNPAHYDMVAMLLRPQEQPVPQLRFVFQLKDPRRPDRHFEQLYVHLNFDAVDRNADERTRSLQHAQLLARVAELARLRDSHDSAYESELADFIAHATLQPVENLAFSSSLSGIWIFGALNRPQNNPAKRLEAVRIWREGIDYGYYSSAYDNDILRAKTAAATGEQKNQWQQILDDLTVTHYRDEKRQDVHALRFERITCAQCHQMSGRDAVHISVNDKIDRRISWPVRASEFVFRTLEDQLKQGSQEK